MAMNFEGFFNTPSFTRFVFPPKVYWGVNSLTRVLDFLVEGDIEIFIDQNLEDSCSGFLESIPEARIARISGMPIYEEVIRYVADFPIMSKNIIAIGGGSVIDFAKAVIASRKFGDIENLGIGANSGLQSSNCDSPLFVSIPTTVGSGAESSRYFVLYRQSDKSKVHGKSWDLISSLVLIDPLLIQNLPIEIVASTAFDAFVHYWESSITLGESNLLIRNTAIIGMCTILESIATIINSPDDCEALMNLALMSSVAGITISNGRTGNIHEAAGILLQHTNLTHGETLFVFSRSAYLQYKVEASYVLDLVARYSDFGSFDDVLLFWEGIFQKFNLTNKINAQLNSISDKVDLVLKIENHLLKDDVWNEKESPNEVNKDTIRELARSVLFEF